MAEFLKNINTDWTLFLDRDGVLNERIYGGYVNTSEGFKFLPGVLESMSVFASFFGKIIVVTNQQGVGKGEMTESELENIHRYMKAEIARAGGRLDAIYCCTDLATKKEHCRKPGIYLAMQAKKDFPEIDFQKSIMVGDTKSDMEFGRNSGMLNVLVGNEKVPENLVHLYALDLLDFSRMILKTQI
ncbi:MAG: HAD-IIIA family hydrolase [Bacteroidales bacterium]|nr:HAD-IIIA family hydrolase [Bacteroidales bacterium]